MRFEAMLDAFHKVVDGPMHKIGTSIKDMSRGGMRISSGDELKKGSMVELEMLIPGDNIPVFATGEVAWSSKKQSDSYDSGIRIIKIDSFDRAKLMEYVYDEWIKTKKEKAQPIYQKEE